MHIWQFLAHSSSFKGGFSKVCSILVTKMGKFVIKRSTKTPVIVAESRITIEIEKFKDYKYSEYVNADNFEMKKIGAKW